MRPLPLFFLALLAGSCAPEGDEGVHEHAPEAEEAAGLVLGEDELAAVGLRTAAVTAAEWTLEVPVFGSVEHDPAASTSLVAPLPGRLERADDGAALQLGAELAPGCTPFRLVPRWSPQELADRAARRVEAAGEGAALEASLPGLRSAAERARALNAADRSVSDRELEEALRELAVAESRLASARALEAALAPAADALALVLPRGGTLVALDAHVGEEVEAGRELLRVEDFAAPLVRLELSARHAALPPGPARVELPSGASVTARFVAPAPAASGTPGITRLYRIDDARARGELRPGTLVRAWLPEPAPPRTGVLVPESALVRLAGATFVYTATGAGGFEREPIELVARATDGWHAAGLEPGVEIVVEGAQALLTFELLGRQGEDEE